MPPCGVVLFTSGACSNEPFQRSRQTGSESTLRFFSTDPSSSTLRTSVLKTLLRTGVCLPNSRSHVRMHCVGHVVAAAPRNEQVRMPSTQQQPAMQSVASPYPILQVRGTGRRDTLRKSLHTPGMSYTLSEREATSSRWFRVSSPLLLTCIALREHNTP